MEELDDQGGIVDGVASGWVQAEVNRQAYELEKKLRSGDFPKVGVNIHVDEDEDEAGRDMEFHPYRKGEADKQLDRLAKVKEQRDDEQVARTLAAVRAAAESETNVMPPILDAVEAYATVGEVISTLKDVFGTYKEPVRF
jgi:methylmalonyl-CoA mutase N-terminal domain/subunit